MPFDASQPSQPSEAVKFWEGKIQGSSRSQPCGSGAPTPHSPQPHSLLVDAVRARWAQYEAENGEGFTARHAGCFQADLDAASRMDANRRANERADAALRLAGDKVAAFKMLLEAR